MIEKVFAAMAFAVLSSSALAGGNQAGYIANLLIRSSDGLVYVYITGAASDKPACAKNVYWMIKDENSPTGMKQLALLMMAQSKKRFVNITGAGTCSRWSDGEDIDVVNVSDSPAT